MADCVATGLKQPTSSRGNGLFAQSSASWRCCGQLRQAVAAKLKRNWSPEQIAGWLKRTLSSRTRRDACRTRPSIEAFMCRRGAC